MTQTPQAVDSARSTIRLAWLNATTEEELKDVEEQYRKLIKTCKAATKETANPAYRITMEDAVQRLALLLCQQGRDDDAVAVLGKKYVARLAPCVLNYPLSTPLSVDDAPPCIVVDHAVQLPVLTRLDEVFLSPDADYWTSHEYCVEPPTPYFSYVTEVGPAVAGGLGALGALIRAGLESIAARWGAERAAAARYAELWAHNRPHASGHQMHFDSDDEGRGGVRNPIASGVIYLTTNVGGPTLVTNQRLGDTELASKGWIAHPRRNRLVVFDGTVLHGVVPGKGVLDTSTTTDTRRVTVMIALWEDICIRPGAGPGSARPLPPVPDASETNPHAWLPLLCGPLPTGMASEDGVQDARREVAPVALPHVWTIVNGQTVWPAGTKMPPYEKAFQGF